MFCIIPGEVTSQVFGGYLMINVTCGVKNRLILQEIQKLCVMQQSLHLFRDLYFQPLPLSSKQEKELPALCKK